MGFFLSQRCYSPQVAIICAGTDILGIRPSLIPSKWVARLLSRTSNQSIPHDCLLILILLPKMNHTQPGLFYTGGDSLTS